MSKAIAARQDGARNRLSRVAGGFYGLGALVSLGRRRRATGRQEKCIFRVALAAAASASVGCWLSGASAASWVAGGGAGGCTSGNWLGTRGRVAKEKGLDAGDVR